MLAYRLIRHAVEMIFQNLVPALKVSAIPLAMYLLTVFLLYPGNLSMFPAKLAFLIAIVCFGVLLVVLAMAAVSWHRFVLLEEPVRWSGLGNGAKPFVYILFSVMVAAVYLVPHFLVLNGISGSFGTIMVWLSRDDVPVVHIPVREDYLVIGLGVALLIAALTFTIRLSLALPDVAIGSVRGVFGSLQATKGRNLTIVGTVLFLYLMHFVFNWVASTIGFGLVYDLPGAWFLTMLQLSILTTLYSHFAKGRELS